MYWIMPTPTASTSLPPSRSRGWWLVVATALALPASPGARADAQSVPESLSALIHSVDASAGRAAQASAQAVDAGANGAQQALRELRTGLQDLGHGTRAEAIRARHTILESRDELARWLGLAPR
ncbi:MAG: hypothetical protein AMJ69_00890 [Gammaproteobacteria bacterium SG8_47]|nr:MAG: hypothetical protein AMJ69_00890 [Gammaproteobacteria bacterium SG8_47]